MTTLLSILLLAAIIIVGSAVGCVVGWAISWIVIKTSGGHEILGVAIAILAVVCLTATAIVMVTQ